MTVSLTIMGMVPGSRLVLVDDLRTTNSLIYDQEVHHSDLELQLEDGLNLALACHHPDYHTTLVRGVIPEQCPRGFTVTMFPLQEVMNGHTPVPYIPVPSTLQIPTGKRAIQV